MAPVERKLALRDELFDHRALLRSVSVDDLIAETKVLFPVRATRPPDRVRTEHDFDGAVRRFRNDAGPVRVRRAPAPPEQFGTEYDGLRT